MWRNLGTFHVSKQRGNHRLTHRYSSRVGYGRQRQRFHVNCRWKEKTSRILLSTMTPAFLARFLKRDEERWGRDQLSLTLIHNACADGSARYVSETNLVVSRCVREGQFLWGPTIHTEMGSREEGLSSVRKWVSNIKRD